VVAAPIVGATKSHHLADAVAVLDVHLTDDEVRTLVEPYTMRPTDGVLTGKDSVSDASWASATVRTIASPRRLPPVCSPACIVWSGGPLEGGGGNSAGKPGREGA
jgi:hypothetical protein